MKLLKGVLQDIRSGENIELYLTILIAASAIVLETIGFVSQDIVLSVVLMAVALIAFGMLESRKTDNSLKESIKHLQRFDTSSSQFFVPQYFGFEIKPKLTTATEAFFWGLTLERTILFLRHDLEKAIKSGTKIRILLLKPHSNATRMTAFRSIGRTEEDIDLSLQKSLRELEIIGQICSESPESLEVRVIDYLPPWSIIGISSAHSENELFINLMAFRAENENRPAFTLSMQKDQQWFEFFRNQFELAWSAAENIKLKM